MLLGLKLMLGSTPLPSVAFGSKPMIWKGEVAAVFRPNSYGKGKTSNIPKPPRTAVFPSLKGSQEKPMRGSKFFVVGLLRMKLSTCTGPQGLVRLGPTPGVAQLASVVISWIRLLASFGLVVNS